MCHLKKTNNNFLITFSQNLFSLTYTRPLPCPHKQFLFYWIVLDHKPNKHINNGLYCTTFARMVKPTNPFISITICMSRRKKLRVTLCGFTFFLPDHDMRHSPTSSQRYYMYGSCNAHYTFVITYS